MATTKPVALYIHWPFCKAKCPYCDFNSHVRETVPQERWLHALLREMETYARLTDYNRLTSIFFGGGTPSLMPPETVDALIQRANELWPFDRYIEITLEANPTSVEAANFQALAHAGVNRVSLGVQSLRPEALTFLGRKHTVEEALKAVELATATFPRASFDLIYALPGQTPDAWEQELRDALTHAPEHLSVYQLTIEPGTQFFHRHKGGEFALPPEEEAEAMYLITQAYLSGVGMPAYEISNHAKPGARSRHNLTYWRYGDYIGIGPGAHGRIHVQRDGEPMVEEALLVRPRTRTHVATQAVKSPEQWLAAVETKSLGLERSQSLNRQERLEEFLLMGLRLREGIPRERFVALFGSPPEILLNRRAIAKLIRNDLLILNRHGLQATERGFFLLDYVLQELVSL